MKKFLIKILLLLPFPIIVIATNYMVDPANLFRATISETDGDTYEDQMINFIAEGYNVTNVETYNERLFNQAFIESFVEAPEIAVFGSSKSQLINDSFFEQKLINNSVTGATLEDVFGLFNVYRRKENYPSKVIIELSPGVLNDNNASIRWLDIEDEFIQMKKVLYGDDQSSFDWNKYRIPPKYLELISFEYFQESLKHWKNGSADQVKSEAFFKEDEFNEEYSLDSLFAQVSNAGFTYVKEESQSKIEYLNSVLQQEDFYAQWSKLYPDEELMEEDQNLVNETLKDNNEDEKVFQEKIILRNRKLFESTFWEHCPILVSSVMFKTMDQDNDGLTICKDGSISYPFSFRNRDLEEVNYAAEVANNNEMLGFEDYDLISEDKIDLIKKFIEFCKENDIEVIFYLAPFHPLVYQGILQKEVWQVAEAEKALLNVASEYNVKVVGAYDPKQIGMSEKDFLDGLHLRRASLRKLFE